MSLLYLGKQLEVGMGNRHISIEQIKKLAKQGLAQLDIARHLGCSRQYINQVVKQHNIEIKKVLRWQKKPKKLITCPTCNTSFMQQCTERYCTLECKRIRFTKIPRRFSPKEIRAIRKDYANGMSVQDLADFYGVKKVTIYFILQGRSYAYVK